MTKPVRERLLSHSYVQYLTACTYRYRRWLGALVAMFVLFGVLGYFWLPGFAKGKLEQILAEQLHRPVSVQKIDINPYTLELTIHGFRIGAAEGNDTLFSFDSLYVNLSSVSVVRGAPVISAITLKAPHLHLTRESDGKLDIADLIEKFQKQPKSEGTARFSVSNIEIEDGDIEFDDKLKKSRQHISDLSLGIPFVASFASDDEVWVEPHFKARINDGAMINAHGKVRPFAEKREASINLTLDGLDLTGIDEYAPALGALHLRSALLDSQLEISFIQSDHKAAATRINGDVSLRKLSLDNSTDLPWQLQGERIAVRLKDFDPFLSTPITTGVEADKLRFRQGDKPEMRINRLAVDAVQIDTAAHKASFALTATVNEKGSLKTKGSVAWAPLAADLEIKADQVDIVALQGMAIQHPFVVATKGALSFDGTVKASGSPLNVAVEGAARVSDFNLLDKTNNDDLLRWSSLDISGISLTTAPLNVNIKSVVGADLFAKVVVMPDGSLRLQDVIARRDASGSPPVGETPAMADSERKPAPPAATKTEATPVVAVADKAPLPIRIDEIVLKNGSLNFYDRFIKPNYRANLSSLNGRIGPLYPGQRGDVSVQGRVNRTAPLDIRGKIDPFGKALYLDLAASAKGIDMPGFSPYSGRYLGYAIEKGKLSVDLHYYIEKGELRAENHIFLDQFTLGEKIDSPNAISVPLGLAVALLKNSRGEIDINLPVSGSLNDPQFSVGGLVVKVFVNLIVKAVTAPFALLGSLFGGGADLSHIDFAPGYAQLTPEAGKKLDAISKAMADRPGMKVEISGVADAVNDPPGLKQAGLERRVKAQKLAALAKEGKSGGSVSDVTVETGEYAKYLELAYKAEKFDKPHNLIGMNKSLPVPEMERLMLEHMPAGDDDLRALAERRARAAQDALLSRGVASERVFVIQPRIDSAGDSKNTGFRVDFSLR